MRATRTRFPSPTKLELSGTTGNNFYFLQRITEKLICFSIYSQLSVQYIDVRQLISCYVDP